jgi:hypothetical protein
VQEFLLVASFFSAMLCAILLAERLTVEGSTVEIASYGRAIIGGLIAAKVILVVDHLPFVNLFPDRPLVWNVAWKLPLYTAGTLAFRYLEPFVKGLFHGEGVAGAHRRCVEEFSKPLFWANQIWITLLLAAFISFRELTRVLGRAKAREIFFGKASRES